MWGLQTTVLLLLDDLLQEEYLVALCHEHLLSISECSELI